MTAVANTMAKKSLKNPLLTSGEEDSIDVENPPVLDEMPVIATDPVKTEIKKEKPMRPLSVDASAEGGERADKTMHCVDKALGYVPGNTRGAKIGLVTLIGTPIVFLILWFLKDVIGCLVKHDEGSAERRLMENSESTGCCFEFLQWFQDIGDSDNKKKDAHNSSISATLISGHAPIIQRAGFTAVISKEKDKRVHVTISQAGCPMTWGAAITALAEDTNFRTLLIDTLVQMPFTAFFWECPAVTAKTKEQKAFEFVATDAGREFANQKANPNSFSKHIDARKGHASAVAFDNMGGDAKLVVPTQFIDDPKPHGPYGHLAEFVRAATPDMKEQQEEVFKKLGEELQLRMQEKGPSAPICVSTHGVGVPWLHLRIDSQPKYYHYLDYKNTSYGLPAAN